MFCLAKPAFKKGTREMNQNTFCKYCHRIPSQCGCTHPVKELTDEEIDFIFFDLPSGHSIQEFARAILRKAQK